MVFVTVLNLTFAVICYMLLGYCTQGSVTQNFPSGWLPILVESLLCVDLLFTYTIFMIPLSEMIEGLLKITPDRTYFHLKVPLFPFPLLSSPSLPSLFSPSLPHFPFALYTPFPSPFFSHSPSSLLPSSLLSSPSSLLLSPLPSLLSLPCSPSVPFPSSSLSLPISSPSTLSRSHFSSALPFLFLL